MNIPRRRFIKLTSLTSASLTLLNWTSEKNSYRFSHDPAPVSDELYNMFRAPKNIHQPFVRWWWNGDRVKGEEVLRELDIMKEAGIGGVEINPIKWNENADAIGIKELSWGSDEWLDVVEVAVKGAKEKGMVCDMIVGSGWPFGGEFVPHNEQSQIVILGTRDLEAGKKYNFTPKELLDSVSAPSNYKNRVSELFMLRLAPAEMNAFTAGTDLNSLLKNETIEITVPEGAHVLYFLVKITGFQTVIQGALGANGPVINHYEKSAVENYLNGFGEKLTGKLGPLKNYFRAFFTDSIELEGANWCSDMFEQFKQRRGYDVEPYFPFILFKVGEMGNAVNEVYGSKFSPETKSMLNLVHYDFEETRIELFHERFIKTFTDWCGKHEVRSRMQAYGMDCHPLEASMMLDIPECETWIWRPEIEEFSETGGGRAYTMINKFVSSAAHLVGKQLISCEEMTNTGQIFSTTLEKIKTTGDQSNLSGVTHSIIHGFNYSPVESVFPGWIRYGSFLNERNTWWPYFRLWSDYKARLSCVLQNSVMQADIAVLHPLADLASRYGFQRDPFPRVAYPAYVHRVWEAIHQLGNGCDYLSEHIIQQALMKKGTLNYQARSYRTLILIEVETLQPETARAIRKFADAGGRILFVGQPPHMSSGLTGYQKKSKEIVHISQSILHDHPETAVVVPVPGKDLISWYEGIQKKFSLTPYISISDPVHFINQMYYKDADRDIFFFVNYSPVSGHEFKAVFKTKKTGWLWNPETGERFIYPVSADGTMEISLGPSESKLVVFEDNHQGEPYQVVNSRGMTETIIHGPWELSLNHVNDTHKKMMLDDLTDLKKIPDLRDFSGTINYRKSVNLTALSKKTLLHLGHIHDVSELEVNGQPMGAKWYGDHLYDISKAVRAGDNYINIRITTTLGAYTQSLKNNKAAQEWSREALYGPTGLDAPVRIFTGT